MAKNSFRVSQSLTFAAQASPPSSPVANDVYGDGTDLYLYYSASFRPLVTTTATQTLTNKTLTAPTITGGTASALTAFALRDTSAAFDVTLAATSSTALTAGRTLTLDMVNAARSVKLQGNLDVGGNLTTAAAFTTSGANSLTLTTTATTTATLPSGTVTLAALGTNQTFSGTNVFTADTGFGDSGASPAYRIDLRSTTNNANLVRLYGQRSNNINLDIAHHTNSATSPDLRIRLIASRGTLAAPTQIKSSDVIASIQGFGYDNAGTPALQQGTSINMAALEDFTSTAAGSKLGLFTCAIGSTTLTEVITAKFSGCAVKGTTTNDDAAAGFNGEFFTQTKLRSAATGMATNTQTNVLATPITLTAGDWEISAMLGFTTSTTTATLFEGGISSSAGSGSATLPGADTLAVPTSGEVRLNAAVSLTGTSNDDSISFPPYRVSISASTTFYLVARAQFSLGTVAPYGSLKARRIR